MSSPKFVFAIVIYRLAPLESVTIRTLLDGLRTIAGLTAKILVLDNSPVPAAAAGDGGGFEYVAFGRNVGLAQAYRHAAAFAKEHRAEFVVTLDQDSVVSPEYLAGLRDYACRYSGQEVVLCPRILSAGRVVSPYFYGPDGRPHFGSGTGPLHAINSFSAYAVSLLTEKSVIDDYYWLDALDFAIYENVHRHCVPVILMEVDVAHSLSVVDGSINAQRLTNMAHYEAAFLFQYCGIARLCSGLLRLLARVIRLGCSGLGVRATVGALRASLTGSLAGLRRRGRVAAS